MSPERLEQFEKDALLHKLQDENSRLKLILSKLKELERHGKCQV